MLIALLACFILGWNGASAINSVDTFKRAHQEWIWSVDSGLLGSSHLRRQEIAPILVKYITQVAKKDYRDRWCNAIDLNSADVGYQESLKTLCGYGIMMGERNRLLPQQYLTNGQAITMVMRIVDGYQKEATIKGQHWAQPYFERAKVLGYEGITPIYYRKNFPITLETLINFLWSVSNPNQTITSTIWSAPWEGNENRQALPSSDDMLSKLAEIMTS